MARPLVGAESANNRCGLAEACGLGERIEAMFRGEKINTTKGRAVLHVALRAPRGESIVLDGDDVVAHLHEVLDRMAAFADHVRDGRWREFPLRVERGRHRLRRGDPRLDPAETLFIVSSRTFTALETMANAHTAR